MKMDAENWCWRDIQSLPIIKSLLLKKAPEPVVSEAKPIDLTTKTNKSTEKLIPQEREDKTSTNQAVEASGEDVGIEKIGVVSLRWR